MENTKFEYRNPKQIRISNDRNSKRVWVIWNLDFEIISDFGFRASDLQNRRLS